MAAGSFRDSWTMRTGRMAAGRVGSTTVPVLRSVVFVMVFAPFTPLIAGVRHGARATGLRLVSRLCLLPWLSFAAARVTWVSPVFARD